MVPACNTSTNQQRAGEAADDYNYRENKFGKWGEPELLPLESPTLERGMMTLVEACRNGRTILKGALHMSRVSKLLLSASHWPILDLY
jgi:hypothetical protein